MRRRWWQAVWGLDWGALGKRGGRRCCHLEFKNPLDDVDFDWLDAPTTRHYTRSSRSLSTLLNDSLYFRVFSFFFFFSRFKSSSSEDLNLEMYPSGWQVCRTCLVSITHSTSIPWFFQHRRRLRFIFQEFSPFVFKKVSKWPGSPNLMYWLILVVHDLELLNHRLQIWRWSFFFFVSTSWVTYTNPFSSNVCFLFD